MTAEAIGQTMYDLHAAFLSLKHLGTDGLIVASQADRLCPSDDTRRLAGSLAALSRKGPIAPPVAAMRPHPPANTSIALRRRRLRRFPW